MTEDIRVFLYLNLILSLVPILVGILVRNLLVNVRRHREDVEKVKETLATIVTNLAVTRRELKDLKEWVARLNQKD